MHNERKRLYRSRSERLIAGVCGGLAEYLGIDPVLVRVAWVVLTLAGGFGIALYIFWIFIVPLDPAVPPAAVRADRKGVGGVLFGSALIVAGLFFLADRWHWLSLHRFWDWTWEYLGPALLIGLGVWFLLRSRKEPAGTAEPSPAGSDEPRDVRPASRIRKSASDKRVFGVCGGIGEYAGIDGTIVRLMFIGLTLASPPVGILTYVALAILLPAPEPRGSRVATETS